MGSPAVAPTGTALPLCITLSPLLLSQHTHISLEQQWPLFGVELCTRRIRLDHEVARELLHSDGIVRGGARVAQSDHHGDCRVGRGVAAVLTLTGV